MFYVCTNDTQRAIAPNPDSKHRSSTVRRKFSGFHSCLSYSPFSSNTPTPTHSQGQVEYKARPFLETLYSMRDIELHLIEIQGGDKLYLRHNAKATTCGGCCGRFYSPFSRTAHISRGVRGCEGWGYNFFYITLLRALHCPVLFAVLD